MWKGKRIIPITIIWLFGIWAFYVVILKSNGDHFLAAIGCLMVGIVMVRSLIIIALSPKKDNHHLPYGKRKDN
jgi:hypothetical protein